MLTPLLPQRADNSYRGHRLGLWLLGLVLLVKTAISLGTIFNGRDAAVSADGIPIDSYTAAGAQTVVSLFALLGLSQLMLCVASIVVMIRYRALVPFMFALLLVYHLGRQVVLVALPIVRTGAPPGAGMNVALLTALLVGFALSRWSRGEPQAVG